MDADCWCFSGFRELSGARALGLHTYDVSCVHSAVVTYSDFDSEVISLPEVLPG